MNTFDTLCVGDKIFDIDFNNLNCKEFPRVTECVVTKITHYGISYLYTALSGIKDTYTIRKHLVTDDFIMSPDGKIFATTTLKSIPKIKATYFERMNKNIRKFRKRSYPQA